MTGCDWPKPVWTPKVAKWDCRRIYSYDMALDLNVLRDLQMNELSIDLARLGDFRSFDGEDI